jgi:hypothetical protein
VRTNRRSLATAHRQNYYMGKSALHSLNMSFTKRMSHNWQGAINYSLSGLWSGSATR